MKPPEELIRLIQKSKITTGPEADERILRDALNEMEKRRRDNRAPLDAVLWRALMKNNIAKIGTAFVVLIAAVVAFQFLGNTFGTKLTFASVIKPVMNAYTAAFDVVGPDDGKTWMIHELVMGSRLRYTLPSGNETNIVDYESRRMLTLNRANMEARFTNFETSMPNYMEKMKDSIQTLQDSPGFTVEDLGRKKLDGHEVVGFFGSHPRIEITIWADVDTGLPVRITWNMGQFPVTLKNIEFDLPMDEDLFSMEIPAGYTVQESTTAGTEANFIAGLRMIAQRLNYGFFPDSVSTAYTMKWIPELGKRIDAMNLPRKEVYAIEQQIAEYGRFIILFSPKVEWTYRGKGVRLGEIETPIFWYKPQGSETYRVIYGDLRVENAVADSLPR